MPKPKKARKPTATTTAEPVPQTEPVQHRFTVTTDEREQVIRAEYIAFSANGTLALQTEEVILAVFQPDHWRSCVRADAAATLDLDGDREREPDAEPKPVEDE